MKFVGLLLLFVFLMLGEEEEKKERVKNCEIHEMIVRIHAKERYNSKIHNHAE